VESTQFHDEIELEIAILLSELKQPDLVADRLLKKYEDIFLSKSQLHSISQFFIQSGFKESLLIFSLKHLQMNNGLSWPHFAEALYTNQNADNLLIVETLIRGAQETEALDELSKSSIYKLNPELEKARASKKRRFSQELDMQKSEWLSQVQMFKSQRMQEEELNLLLKLKKYFPLDTKIQEMLNDSTARKAQHSAEQTEVKESHQHIRNILKEPRSAEDQTLLTLLTEQIQETLKKSETHLDDFVLLFCFLEAFDHAAELYKTCSKVPEASKWLYLEVLILSDHFLETLQLVQSMESNFQDDPDTMFGLAYLKAQALWGLNRRFEAIEILEQIIQLRPDYRTAQSLLSEWRTYTA
jgi:hypothetical protein